MKLILLCLFMSAFWVGCSNSPIDSNRGPASKPNPVSKLAKDTKADSPKILDAYLKYYLIKNSTFEKIDTQDCRAYAQQNQFHCKTDECKAILSEQDFRCIDQTCKALLTSREDLCTDETCRAIVTNQPEKYKVDNHLCISILNAEASKCTDGTDCRAFIEKNPFKCKSIQCKAIINENLNFCSEQQ